MYPRPALVVSPNDSARGFEHIVLSLLVLLSSSSASS